MDIHEKKPNKRNAQGLKVKLIQQCARCGGSHEHVVFNKFTNPIVDRDNITWGYWVMCPTLNEPIIMHRGNDEQEKDSDE